MKRVTLFILSMVNSIFESKINEHFRHPIHLFQGFLHIQKRMEKGIFVYKLFFCPHIFSNADITGYSEVIILNIFSQYLEKTIRVCLYPTRILISSKKNRNKLFVMGNRTLSLTLRNGIQNTTEFINLSYLEYFIV